MVRRLLSLVVCLMLAACGTISNAYGPARFSLAQNIPDTGVVMFSASAVSRCIHLSTFLKVLRDGDSYRGREVALPAVDAYTIPSDFDDRYGFVHMMRLPAGRYYVSPWTANPYVVPIRLPRFTFRVEAGEMVYLGEYHMPVSCSLSTLAVINDQWARDSALIAAQHPALDLSAVSIRFFETEPLRLGPFEDIAPDLK